MFQFPTWQKQHIHPLSFSLFFFTNYRRLWLTAQRIKKEDQEAVIKVCMCVCSVTSIVSDSLRPHDCNSPGSPVHGILYARILECVAFPFKGSSQPRDRTHVSCGCWIAGGFFTAEPLGKPVTKGCTVAIWLNFTDQDSKYAWLTHPSIQKLYNYQVLLQFAILESEKGSEVQVRMPSFFFCLAQDMRRLAGNEALLSLWVLTVLFQSSKEHTLHTFGGFGKLKYYKVPSLWTELCHPTNPMATHSSILAWKIPLMKEPGGLHSPQGHKESDTTERRDFPFHQPKFICQSPDPPVFQNVTLFRDRV